MAKQAKVPQTEWTTAGMDISRTATPLYQSNLQRMDDYLSDPSATMDKYLNKYYGADSAQYSDFLRQYNRAMGNTTANNYAATQGGYTSSGQRSYMDNQRAMNDLASRLQQYGVNSAALLGNQDYQNMLAANSAYNNAYMLGKNYSNIEQQNALIDAQNKNWWSNLLSAAGQAGMASGNPWGMALGAAANTVGGMTATDTSNAQNTLASIYGGYGASPSTQNNTFTNLFNQMNKYDWTPVGQWYQNKFGKATTGTANPNFDTSLNSGNLFGGLNTNANNVTNKKFSWM